MAEPTNRIVKKPLVTVRVIGKQSISEGGQVYHPERKAGGKTTPADTFECEPERAEALGDHVAIVEKPSAESK
jgi:hypothetical protein